MRTTLLLAIVIGLALGLLYAWLLDPLEFRTADPYHVESRYRGVWIVMSAEAYLVSGDWDRTQARLDGLNDPNLAQTVSALFERASADGPNDQARALAYLADRLGARTAGMVVYLTTPVVTPTARPTRPVATPTPPLIAPTPTDAFPTLTPTATPTPEFSLASRDNVCETGVPQIRVNVQDLEGNGLPGVDIWVTWNSGADRFVTGLKPEFGSGFADFEMQPGVNYRVGAGTQSALALVSNLRADPCTTEAGEAGRLSWNIVLQPVGS
ncbi:MAG TPA: hypothetical protein VJG32_06590 [Anaerolineae bacterium]|nr:hypothetical protein [Anaerolineae bacterium]